LKKKTNKYTPPKARVSFFIFMIFIWLLAYEIIKIFLDFFQIKIDFFSLEDYRNKILSIILLLIFQSFVLGFFFYKMQKKESFFLSMLRGFIVAIFLFFFFFYFLTKNYF